MPDKVAPPAADQPADPNGSGRGHAERRRPRRSEDAARPEVDPNAPIPEIIYDISKLPEPVQRKRQMIIDACKTGDLEKIRPLLDTGDDATQLSLGGIDGDPITFLRDLSGDKEGQEILAILEEVMSAGFVHMDAGTENDMYVWPYFFAVPLDKLTAAAAGRAVQDRDGRRLRGHEDLRYLHLLPRRHHAGRPLVVLRGGRLARRPYASLIAVV